MTKLKTRLLKDLPIKTTPITDEDYVINSNNGTTKLKVKDITKNVENKVEILEDNLSEFSEQLETIANKGTTVEVLERVTKEEIDRQIEDGTIANLTIAPGSITKDKLDPNIKFGVEDGGVTTEKIADKQITYDKLSDSIFTVDTATEVFFENGRASSYQGYQLCFPISEDTTNKTFQIQFELEDLKGNIVEVYPRLFPAINSNYPVGGDIKDWKKATTSNNKLKYKDSFVFSKNYDYFAVYVMIKCRSEGEEIKFNIKNTEFTVNSIKRTAEKTKLYNSRAENSYFKDVQIGDNLINSTMLKKEIENVNKGIGDTVLNALEDYYLYNIEAYEQTNSGIIKPYFTWDSPVKSGDNFEFRFKVSNIENLEKYFWLYSYVNTSNDWSNSKSYDLRVNLKENVEYISKGVIHADGTIKLMPTFSIVDRNNIAKITLYDVKLYINGKLFEQKYNGVNVYGSKKLPNIMQIYHSASKITTDKYLTNLGVNPLRGVKWCVLGDSITDIGRVPTSSTYKKYHSFIQEQTGCIVQNLGWGGKGWQDLFDVEIDLIDDDVDMISIFTGTNDIVTYSKKGGSPTDSTDVDTWCGLVKRTLNKLINKFPLVPIYIFTPIPRADVSQIYLECLSNIASDLVDISRMYSIPVLDLYSSSNLRPHIDEYNKKYFNAQDKLHPNELAHRTILAPKIMKFLIANM